MTSEKPALFNSLLEEGREVFTNVYYTVTSSGFTKCNEGKLYREDFLRIAFLLIRHPALDVGS